MRVDFCPHVFVKCSGVFSTQRFIQKLPWTASGLKKRIYDFLNHLFQSSAKAQTDGGGGGLDIRAVVLGAWQTVDALIPAHACGHHSYQLSVDIGWNSGSVALRQTPNWLALFPGFESITKVMICRCHGPYGRWKGLLSSMTTGGVLTSLNTIQGRQSVPLLPCSPCTGLYRGPSRKWITFLEDPGVGLTFCVPEKNSTKKNRFF